MVGPEYQNEGNVFRTPIGFYRKMKHQPDSAENWECLFLAGILNSHIEAVSTGCLDSGNPLWSWSTFRNCETDDVPSIVLVVYID